MRNLLIIPLLFVSMSLTAQENLEDLLAAGIEDAKRFTDSYISPATESTIYNLSNSWVQEAKSKKPLRFDISIIGTASFIKDENKTFLLDTRDYNNLQFRDGSISKNVATAFGENDPDIVVFAEVQNGVFNEEVEFILPQGLASVDVNVVPSAFLQARLGLFKGAEIKARYFPKVDREDVKVGLVGAGFQYEFTSLLPADNVFPVAIAGVVGYTNLTANYDFTDDEIIEGDNQQFDLVQDSWVLQLQASTTMKVINFYGGLGYVTGTSDFQVLGTYRVRAGVPLLETTNEFTDPYAISQDVSGIRANIGAKLQLGFFGLHADYNIAQYNTITVGTHFGI